MTSFYQRLCSSGCLDINNTKESLLVQLLYYSFNDFVLLVVIWDEFHFTGLPEHKPDQDLYGNGQNGDSVKSRKPLRKPLRCTKSGQLCNHNPVSFVISSLQNLILQLRT